MIFYVEVSTLINIGLETFFCLLFEIPPISACHLLFHFR